MTREPAPVLWEPTRERMETSLMRDFMGRVGERHGASLSLHSDLERWALENKEAFWRELLEWSGISFAGDPAAALVDGDSFLDSRWFPDVTLNYAQNLLAGDPEGIAIFDLAEGGEIRRVTRGELRRAVRALADRLRELGVGRGDRVAAVMPASWEGVAALLATASIGAVWSSCSPDFGPEAIANRFGQIGPKVAFAADGYAYNGRRIETRDRIMGALSGIGSVESVIGLRFLDRDAPAVDPGLDFASVVAGGAAGDPDFERVPFDHPLYILYTSGTTGKPKCIVHGHGGSLLEHVKEHRLHVDLRPGERMLYYTTCGWMMWNWLVSGLASGATVCLYDGAPLGSRPEVLWEMADRIGVDVFGTSAKYLLALEKSGISLRGGGRELRRLRAVLSTGSPLAESSYDYVYRELEGIHLQSISGGTDIVGCFVLGSPLLPVRRGEIQCASLGYDMDVLDAQGGSVTGEQGELVCRSTIPNKPVGFWGDAGRSRYRASYFDRFRGMWTHGDFARRIRNVHERFGEYHSIIVDGRSDATLNPGGVRIGTAEIYGRVERFGEVYEALATSRQDGDDEHIVLFLVMRAGPLTEDLRDRIRADLASHLSIRHVPKWIFEVSDLPRTRSGKIAELAVRDAINGRLPEGDTLGQLASGLANPQSLDLFVEGFNYG